MRTGPASERTLWEEGHVPARGVVVGATTLTTLLVLLDIVLGGRVGVLFDVAFVLVCLVAALAVRPGDFFVVGVLPPLLLLGVVTVVALLATGAVAEPGDGVVQAVVSGLAHHATALLVGYGAALTVLAVRQVHTSDRRRARVRHG